jgi:hypothetical protein
MARDSLAGRLGLCVSLLLVSGCSPLCLLEVLIENPAGLVLTRERLRVTGAKACPPASVAAPAPSSERGETEYVRTQVAGQGLEVRAAFRGQRCRLQITAWYDTNGSGGVDAGDWVGSSVAIDVEDRGTLGGNSGRAEPVRLVLAS